MTASGVDVAIIGGGHNGLVAAAYLAKAGLRVIVLERLKAVGGAAVSTQTFEGQEARLSRYSYLVSLLPKAIVDDLALNVAFAPRRFSSYTPNPAGPNGLLIDKQDQPATRSSFESLGCPDDFDAWQEFYTATENLAKVVFPTMLSPLPRRSALASEVGESTWKAFIEEPIGATIQARFTSDLVRGVVLTDALIGTFAPNIDPQLDANRCFLYHVIGNETGEWNIPIGGMGSVTDSMRDAAVRQGAQLITGATVTAIEDSQDQARRVVYAKDGEEYSITASYVLANVSARELKRLMGRAERDNTQGAQVKVNMLLSRLPALKSGADPKQAFGGTLHVNENFSQLQAAFDMATSGQIPVPVPCEIYCHSLTDPTILGDILGSSGAQTLTAFALHTPHQLIASRDPDEARIELENAVLDSINSVLAEDIRGLLLKDAFGNPCIETKTTIDLELALGLPGGNIFHGPLNWPFLEDDESADSPEEIWGVATGFDSIFYCGSAARRGGAVSGVAGHNAAMAVLDSVSARRH